VTGPEDDELLVDDARPSNRTLVLLALLAAALAGLVVVRFTSASPHAHSPAPAPVPRTPVAEGPPDLRLDGTGEPVVDTVTDRGNLLVLRTDSLLRARFDGHVQRLVRLSDRAKLGAEAPAVRLFVDDAHRTGWAVSILERRARVLTFDPATLRPQRLWENDFIVYDAALLDGRVYAGTAEGIAWLDASGHSGHVPGVAGAVSSIAADPLQHRLLAVLGRGVVAVTPAGRISAVVALGVVSASVRVVGDAVWVAGASGRRGLALRLDPVTLRPVRRVPLQVGADVVGTGRAALYFVPSDDSTGLWCVDLRTDVPAHLTALTPVAVTAWGTSAFASSAAGIVPVPDC
jgi:hypothetical protein